MHVLTISEKYHQPTLSCLLVTAEKGARCMGSMRAKQGMEDGSGEVGDTGRVRGGYIPSSTAPLPVASDPRPSRVLLVSFLFFQ